jgi:hypothetical protein
MDDKSDNVVENELPSVLKGYFIKQVNILSSIFHPIL